MLWHCSMGVILYIVGVIVCVMALFYGGSSMYCGGDCVCSMWVILCTVEVIVCFMALFCRGNSMYRGSDRVCYGNVLWGNVVNCGSDSVQW